MLRERPFSIFITSDDLPPLRHGQYRFFVWDDNLQPRGFAIVFPDGEAGGGCLDGQNEESEIQRESRIFSAEQIVAWLGAEEQKSLPAGWRLATPHEATVILYTWRQFAE